MTTEMHLYWCDRETTECSQCAHAKLFFLSSFSLFVLAFSSLLHFVQRRVVCVNGNVVVKPNESQQKFFFIGQFTYKCVLNITRAGLKQLPYIQRFAICNSQYNRKGRDQSYGRLFRCVFFSFLPDRQQ